jgi:predicted AlkP superfamily phosphohydrolase/phosphomutase
MSPPRPTSGYIVPGWVPWRHLRLACHPPDLYEKLKALSGFNARELAMDMAIEGRAIEGCQREEDYEAWIQLHIRRERQWFEILRNLMREDPCHLTAVLFDGVDKLQHTCWRFLDPTHLPATPSAWERKIRSLCLDYFRQIDRFLAEIRALAGSDARVFIASDHGFGETVEIFHLNTWLEHHGYLAWADAGGVERKDAERLGLETLARRFYQVNWIKTKAYSPTPSSNGIYIPLADRGSKEGVLPDDYERFRQELIESLRRFADPKTGEPVVARIRTREEAFSGKYMPLAPDLTLALRDGGFVSILPSETPLKPRREASGAHRPEGIFAAAGSGIRRGVSLPRLSILDVAPTLLYSLGLPIPEDLEGRLPTEMLEPSEIQAHPALTGGPTLPPQPFPDRPGEVVDEEAEAEVIQRLKALGYVE